jgi:hypothetical protein
MSMLDTQMRYRMKNMTESREETSTNQNQTISLFYKSDPVPSRVR